MTERILIAGIGNIFMGDDAFGVETVRELMKGVMPTGVRVVDFGIRSYDLAYALSEGYEVTILVDATTRGYVPGTVCLIEPDLNELRSMMGNVVDGHNMNPVRALQMVESLGGQLGRLYLVGCEPAVLETETGAMGLSVPVQAAVPKAVKLIQSLVNDLVRETQKTGLVEA